MKTTFDECLADRVVAFFPRLLRHTKGRWAGKPFVLNPTQEARVRKIFGTIEVETGFRVAREVHVYDPRKTGKSTWAAGLAIYLTCGDGENSAETIGAAADRDQARIVFRQARAMVEASDLASSFRIYRDALEYRPTDSVYRVVSAQGFRNHGLNPSAVVFDETHCQRTRDLWDALTTGQGARDQPATISISTAGDDPESLCAQLWRYAEDLIAGVRKNPRVMAWINSAPREDDWTKVSTWRKAYPDLGETVTQGFLRDEVKKAQAMPARENAFRRLYLNQWVEQADRWIQLHHWDQAAGKLDPFQLRESVEGERCVLGIDLSSTRDLTGLVAIFPPTDDRPRFVFLPWAFVPEETAATREEVDRVPYRAWQKAGLLEFTPGRSVDYGTVFAKVEQLAELYDLGEIAIDPYNAYQFSQDLIEAGYPVVHVRQGFITMNEPAKLFERLILRGELAHAGHPVLRWNVANVATETDSAGNIKPSKKRSREKIDLVAAAVTALSRIVRAEEPPSIRDEGILFA